MTVDQPVISLETVTISTESGFQQASLSNSSKEATAAAPVTKVNISLFKTAMSLSVPCGETMIS